MRKGMLMIDIMPQALQQAAGTLLSARMLSIDLQGSQAKADQLLLEVYSSINEPDGIYAVARGHSMLSQLKLYEHEGSWDKALAGYDMLCHRKAAQHGQAASLPSLSSPSSSSSYTAAQDRGGASVTGEQGLLTSLQQLGCRHLIEAYWQSQPGSLSQGETKLSGSDFCTLHTALELLRMCSQLWFAVGGCKDVACYPTSACITFIIFTL